MYVKSFIKNALTYIFTETTMKAQKQGREKVTQTEAAREFGTSVAAVSKNEKDAIRNIKKMIGVVINND